MFASMLNINEKFAFFLNLVISAFKTDYFFMLSRKAGYLKTCLNIKTTDRSYSINNFNHSSEFSNLQKYSQL